MSCRSVGPSQLHVGGKDGRSFEARPKKSSHKSFDLSASALRLGSGGGGGTGLVLWGLGWSSTRSAG